MKDIKTIKLLWMGCYLVGVGLVAWGLSEIDWRLAVGFAMVAVFILDVIDAVAGKHSP